MTRRRRLHFRLRQVLTGQTFSIFEFLDCGFLILGLADKTAQGGDLLFGCIGNRDIPLRKRVFGCPAERTGLAVFQPRPVLFKLRNLLQEDHFTQQGFLLGAVFPQQATSKQHAQCLFALPKLC